MPETEIERRLQDLTLDFGLVKQRGLSCPLQMKPLGRWRLEFWVPTSLCKTAPQAVRAFRDKRLPVAWPASELAPSDLGLAKDYEPALTCHDFLGAQTALESRRFAAFLPEFLVPDKQSGKFIAVPLPELRKLEFSYALAWNPRLLRLNPHAGNRRDLLIRDLLHLLFRPRDDSRRR